jgi:hypothetical protein
MRFLSWLRIGKLFGGHAGGRAHGAPRRRASFRPRVEVLEAREVPSTLNVTNLNDFGNPGSLRYEIAQANSGDTIAFDKTLAGVITLTSGELVISKNLTIKGPGQYQLTITSQSYSDNLFDPVPGSRILEVDGAGTTVSISGLTITGGGGTVYSGISGQPRQPYDGYGGAIFNFGTLTLSGCQLGGSNLAVAVPNNSAEYGGAIANFGTMTVSGCDVRGNAASGGWVNEGGGIYNAGTLTVSGSSVVGNVAYGTAAEGGGIYNAGTAAALTVVHSTFSNNSPDNIFGPYTDGGGKKVR